MDGSNPSENDMPDDQRGASCVDLPVERRDLLGFFD